MARYRLDDTQREVVETALLVYGEELKKLLKKAQTNRVDTHDIEAKLATIRGDDEDPGLLRIFAKDVDGQEDMFFGSDPFDADDAEVFVGGGEGGIVTARVTVPARAVEEEQEDEDADEDDGTEALVEEMYGAEDEPEDEVVDGITDDSEVALEEVIVEAEKEAGKKQEHAFRGVVPTADPYAPDDEPQKPAESAEDDGVPAHLRDVPVIERTCLVCLEDYGADGTCPDCGDVASWAKDTAEV